MIPSRTSYNLNGPTDPIRHARYEKAVGWIKGIEPDYQPPDPMDVNACEKAELYLKNLVPQPADEHGQSRSVRQRQINEDRELYSEVAQLVAREKERKLIPMDDIIEVPPLRNADDAFFDHLHWIKDTVQQRLHYFKTTSAKERELEARVEALESVNTATDDRIKKLELQFASVEQELSRT